MRLHVRVKCMFHSNDSSVVYKYVWSQHLHKAPPSLLFKKIFIWLRMKLNLNWLCLHNIQISPEALITLAIPQKRWVRRTTQSGSTREIPSSTNIKSNPMKQASLLQHFFTTQCNNASAQFWKTVEDNNRALKRNTGRHYEGNGTLTYFYVLSSATQKLK